MMIKDNLFRTYYLKCVLVYILKHEYNLPITLSFNYLLYLWQLMFNNLMIIKEDKLLFTVYILTHEYSLKCTLPDIRSIFIVLYLEELVYEGITDRDSGTRERSIVEYFSSLCSEIHFRKRDTNKLNNSFYYV